MANKFRPNKIHQNRIKKRNYKVIPQTKPFVNYKTFWDVDDQDPFNYFNIQEKRRKDREAQKLKRDIHKMLHFKIHQQLYFLRTQCQLAKTGLNFTKFRANKLYEWETKNHYFEYKLSKKKRWQLWIRSRMIKYRNWATFYTYSERNTDWDDYYPDSISRTDYDRVFPEWTWVNKNPDLKITLNILRTYNQYEQVDEINTIEDLYR